MEKLHSSQTHGHPAPATPDNVSELQATSLSVTVHFSDPLLVIFVHGFKGTDETFGGFPERLRHILTETLPRVSVECIVFPAYETKGDLNDAVVSFADWLTTLVVNREVASGRGSGKAKIVLCGHSMGGCLIADALLEFIKSRPDKECPIWPNITACLAFDTPYLGLHPFIIKHSVTKAAEYANAAHTVGSAMFGALAGLGAKKATTPTPPARAVADSQSSGSLWSKWAAPAAYAIGGAVLTGAAAGGAYYKREELTGGYTWAMDHMKYVGNLWDEVALKQRVEALVDVEEQYGIKFLTFYALLPPVPPVYLTSRTFIVLPKSSSRAFSHFLPAKNSVAPDEIRAHTGIFEGKTNDGYYELGLATAKIIRESVMLDRNLSGGEETGMAEISISGGKEGDLMDP